MKFTLSAWLFAPAMVYLFTFGIGKLILGPAWLENAYIVIGFVCGAVIYYDFPERGCETFAGVQAGEAEEARQVFPCSTFSAGKGEDSRA